MRQTACPLAGDARWRPRPRLRMLCGRCRAPAPAHSPSRAGRPAADRRRHARAAGRATPAWAPAPGRSERDLAPPRLSLRLTYTQAVQEAGGDRGRPPRARLRRRHRARCSTASTACSSAAAPTSTRPPTARRRHPALGPDVDRVADEYELALLAAAAERDLPMLGDLPRDAGAQRRPRRDAAPAPPRPHGARPPPGRRAVRARARGRRRAPARCCTGSPAAAGSRSTASITRPSTASAPASRSAPARPTATVEALWDPAARFCLGVQWHAELLDAPRRARDAARRASSTPPAASPRSSRSPPDAACQHLRHERLYPSRQHRDP